MSTSLVSDTAGSVATSPAETMAARSPIVFAVPGDLHITTKDQDNYAAAVRVVAAINRLIKPDFVQFVGDNAQEAQPEQFELFQTLRSQLDASSDVMVGDHDVHEDPQAKAFQQYVGATYGVRTFPGVRFLHLNTQQSKPMGLSDEQIDWFRGQVAEAESADQQVVVFQHNYPYQIWESFDGPGVDAWREIVQTHRITAIICGHTHYFQEANDGRNIAIAVRSIGDPEGGAPGYLIGFLQEDDLAFAYRTIEETGPLVLITHPRKALLAAGPKHIVSGDDQVRVFIRSESPVVSVQWRIDTGDWQDFTQTDDSSWAGHLPGESLAKGAHRLEVEVVSEDGQVAKRNQDFMVDPTGRYTAVPTTYPLVTKTEFC